MDSHGDDVPSGTPGSPIRRSSDHRLLGTSPRLIAARHVLHRLRPPRHPPYALSSLTTKCAWQQTCGFRRRTLLQLSNIRAKKPSRQRLCLAFSRFRSNSRGYYPEKACVPLDITEEQKHSLTIGAPGALRASSVVNLPFHVQGSKFAPSQREP